LTISIAITSSLILWIFFKADTLLKIIYVILWSYPFYKLIKIQLLKTPVPHNISLLLNFTVFNWIIFGISLFSLIYLTVIYLSLTRQISPLISRIKEVVILIKSTFKVSIPVTTILKYKMAVCKDYAKLTAVLLYNLFPNNPVYFISIPRHVAAGIEINGKLYILNQKLPVLTLDGWLRVWNRRTAIIYQLKILDSDETKKLKLEKHGIVKLTNPSFHANTEKLIEEVSRLIGINQVTQKEGSIVELPPIPKLAKCYEDDEFVIYSMARAIKLKLENELCGNVNRITKIDIIQDEDKLIIKAHIRPDNSQ